MKHIYLHIPFCRKACNYCDFHFSTSLAHKPALLAAMHHEIGLQANYLQREPVSSVYFGGGTPSLLTANEINAFFATLRQHHTILPTAELTLEANPDDLTDAYLAALQTTPINRLSIGIQSFSNADLLWFNRAHNAADAETVVQRALHYGYHNLSLDLIYGSPTTSDEQWQRNLDTVAATSVAHLSCYALTVEPKTALASQIKKGQAPQVQDETAERHWRILQDWLPASGFEQYEISNFARSEKYAQHNTSYWQGDAYLGIGPAAHSFNGDSRQWNIAHNAKYIQGLQDAKIPFTQEILSERDKVNEYIMTALRTKWGVNLAHPLLVKTPETVENILHESQIFQQNDWLTLTNNTLLLTHEGKLYADTIASNLFVD